MEAGLYGLNGLHSGASLKLWNVHVMNHPVYGLEVLPQTGNNTDNLDPY